MDAPPLSSLLKALESSLARVENPRVICENKCNRTITLQYVQFDEPGEYSSRWSCDATAECGSGNEHFCRFPPLTSDGYGDTPEEAAQACLARLEQVLSIRIETEIVDLDEEEF